ncbi:hypothetical protein J4226_04440 [Candidatus Pacearchaeota archaeon]|nr:hypothetical protein [Candidatus Pacearchaeota archaeon]
MGETDKMKNRYCFAIMFMVLFSLINVSALSLVVHVPEKYTDVVAGERFYFEVEIKYPENPKRKDLRMEYEILDQDGNLVSQAKALKAIETQVSFIDFIVIPESAKDGLHIINVRVKDYDVFSEEVSSSFYVKNAGSNNIIIYLIIIIGATLLIGVLLAVSIILKK